MNIALTVLVGVQACLSLVALLAFLRHLQARDEREQVERRELLNRVQHPHLIPVTAPASPKPPQGPVEVDESDLVGVAQPPVDAR